MVINVIFRNFAHMPFVRSFIFFCFLILTVGSIFAQQELINVDRITDCNRAMHLIAKDSFGFTTPPPGSGNILEYSKNPEKSYYYFEDEHHTSWYHLTIPESGLLTFDIIPMSINDDYDFILYKYSDSDFCKNVVEHKIQPVRTAISRNDKSIGSKTGLKASSLKNFIHSGPGESYSNAVAVKKGEVYYLVLDNCYKNGMGHKIIFNIVREFYINGKIFEQQKNIPLDANISIVDIKNRDTLAQVTSDNHSGNFQLHGFYKDDLNSEYEITVNKKGYFYFDTVLSASFITDSLSSLNIQLPRLEKGKVIRINNINFYGNTTVPYPETKYIFIKLLKVMQTNPGLIIQIEGHTNGCHGGLAYSQNLSDARSKAVKNYLVSKGIKQHRIYTAGYGCSKMLYPNPKNDNEGRLNRRVEIKIISF